MPNEVFPVSRPGIERQIDRPSDVESDSELENRFASNNPFTVLGVIEGVRKADVISARNALLKQWHPDMADRNNLSTVAKHTRITIAINAAWEKLKDQFDYEGNFIGKASDYENRINDDECAKIVDVITEAIKSSVQVDSEIENIMFWYEYCSKTYPKDLPKIMQMFWSNEELRKLWRDRKLMFDTEQNDYKYSRNYANLGIDLSKI